MSEDREANDLWLQALGKLEPGEPIPPAPAKPVDEQVDDAIGYALAEEWAALQFAPAKGQLLTPEQEARKRELWRLMGGKVWEPE